MASITSQTPSIGTNFVSQMEYFTYDQYFKDIATVEKACRKSRQPE
ncbi:MAG: hypothetical protein HWD61_12730 [Parachlamydiaceae bacterium]|nr:MAG: hypothetical protein HWD61_12730 [Parachlamydiaceae bacterium]